MNTKLFTNCNYYGSWNTNCFKIFSLFFFVIFVLLWYMLKQLFTSVSVNSLNSACQDIHLNAPRSGEYPFHYWFTSTKAHCVKTTITWMCLPKTYLFHEPRSLCFHNLYLWIFAEVFPNDQPASYIYNKYLLTKILKKPSMFQFGWRRICTSILKDFKGKEKVFSNDGWNKRSTSFSFVGMPIMYLFWFGLVCGKQIH